MLDVTCEYCGKLLKIPEEYLGKSGRCNHCGALITVTIKPPRVASKRPETELPELPRGAPSKPISSVVAVLFACAALIFSVWYGTPRKPSPSEVSGITPIATAPITRAPIIKFPSAPTSWKPVASWQGSATLNTPLFTVGPNWRIRWDTWPGEYGGTFSIEVRSPQERSSLGLAANVMGENHNTSYQYMTGTFYLEVGATQPWKIFVEEGH
jgi:hypothetical protein